VGSTGFNFVVNVDSSGPARRVLDSLGAAYWYNELGGGYEYTHNWLREASAADPASLAVQMARLAQIRSTDCDGDLVIARGEALLRVASDTAVDAEAHYMVADAYADRIALGAGADPDYDFTQSPAEYAANRARAIAHYRQGLALDAHSRVAQSAWGTAWRLIANLPPTSLRFYCHPD